MSSNVGIGSFFTGVPGDQDSNLEVVFIFTVVGEESNDVVKYMQHTNPLKAQIERLGQFSK